MLFLGGWIGYPGAVESPRATLESMAAAANTSALDVMPLVQISEYGAIAACGSQVLHFRRENVVVGVLGRPFWRNPESMGAIDNAPAVIFDAYRDGDYSIPEQLGGSYLVVIADTDRRHLLMASDHFGIVPAYFAQRGEGMVFASTLGALLAHPAIKAALDRQAIYDYVFFHCVPSPRSVYEGIYKLRPAERIEWSNCKLSTRQYWIPSFAGTTQDAEHRSPSIDTLRGALKQAVARVADDKPNGAFLSGGLDSSSVAGMLKDVAGEASTFTVGFNAAGYDESHYARTAARHFATDHHEYFVTPDDVVDAVPQIARVYDEPFGNSSVVPAFYCAKLAREHGVGLMLAGDGGDELFAGNERYIQQRVFERYFGLPRALRRTLESAYEWAPVLKRLPLAGKGHRYIQQALMGLPDRLQAYNFLNRFDRHEVFDPGWLEHADPESPWEIWRARYRELDNASPLQRMLYLDWKFTLADNDLVKVSHMCALAGVDVHYPMLDDAVVDVAIDLNDRQLLADGRLRAFYKDAMRGFLPEEILTKSKHGFGLPFGVWMREHASLQSLVSDCLSSIRQRGIFNDEFIERALASHRREAPGYYGELLWIIMMLELWMQTHEV